MRERDALEVPERDHGASSAPISRTAPSASGGQLVRIGRPPGVARCSASWDTVASWACHGHADEEDEALGRQRAPRSSYGAAAHRPLLGELAARACPPGTRRPSTDRRRRAPSGRPARRASRPGDRRASGRRSRGQRTSRRDSAERRSGSGAAPSGSAAGRARACPASRKRERALRPSCDGEPRSRSAAIAASAAPPQPAVGQGPASQLPCTWFSPGPRAMIPGRISIDATAYAPVERATGLDIVRGN